MNRRDAELSIISGEITKQRDAYKLVYERERAENERLRALLSEIDTQALKEDMTCGFCGRDYNEDEEHLDGCYVMKIRRELDHETK